MSPHSSTTGLVHQEVLRDTGRNSAVPSPDVKHGAELLRMLHSCTHSFGMHSFCGMIAPKKKEPNFFFWFSARLILIHTRYPVSDYFINVRTKKKNLHWLHWFKLPLERSTSHPPHPPLSLQVHLYHQNRPTPRWRPWIPIQYNKHKEINSEPSPQYFFLCRLDSPLEKKTLIPAPSST